MKKIHAFLIAILDKINNNLLLRITSICLQAVWMPVIFTHLGVRLQLKAADGTITSRGWVVTIAVFALILLVQIAALVMSNQNKQLQTRLDEAYNTAALLSTLSSANIAVDQSDVNVLRDASRNMIRTERGQYVYLLEHYFSPIAFLRELSKQIAICFEKSTAVPTERLVVAMAYRTSARDKWQWVDNAPEHNGLSLKVLSTNPYTLFYQLVQGADQHLPDKHGTIRVYNDKKQAERDGHYLCDDRDADYPNGSIMGHRIVTDGQAMLILTVSSYGSQFTTDTSDNAIRTMEDNLSLIMKRFDPKIERELLKLCLVNRKTTP